MFVLVLYLDQFRIVTDTLEEEALETILSDQVKYLFSSFSGGIGRIKDADITILLQELESVFQCSIGNLNSQLQSFSVVIVEELMIPTKNIFLYPS